MFNYSLTYKGIGGVVNRRHQLNPDHMPSPKAEPLPLEKMTASRHSGLILNRAGDI